ncbi:MAG: YceI family protein [Bacteroidota bacterium]
MKTKYIISLIILLQTNLLTAQQFSADVLNSDIKWIGKKVAGEHYGRIELKSGTFEVANNSIKSGVFIIDMSSITNDDLDNEIYNKKLVDHLKSDDFFGVEKYPEAKLLIKSSTEILNDASSVTADLTIKGITHPLNFMVKKEGNAWTSVIIIDRSKYDVRYGSGSFFDNLGDNTIDDKFTLIVKIEAIPANL